MQEHHDQLLPGRALWFVPGLDCHAEAGVPDVMRGEETQLVGLAGVLAGGRHLVCLPGTHSKWAWLEDGRIVDFATVMTGELYAVLRTHSLLGRLMSDDGHAFDAGAFALGIDRSGEPGGLAHQLFGTRTLALFDRLPGEAAGSYLPGLLIGDEIRHRLPAPTQVHLVGSAALTCAMRMPWPISGSPPSSMAKTWPRPACMRWSGRGSWACDNPCERGYAPHPRTARLL